MKVQKSYFKKVFLLLLLLTGGMNFSFSVVQAATVEQGQELILNAEFGEQLQDMRDGFRPVVPGFHPYVLNFSSALRSYQQLSSEEAGRTAAYIRFCRYLEPALGDTEIIYPFHYFL